MWCLCVHSVRLTLEQLLFLEEESIQWSKAHPAVIALIENRNTMSL